MAERERAASNFNSLVDAILAVHERLSGRAMKAVNVALTMRNWLIGYHIHEFELYGMDRATYGDRLLEHLANHLQKNGLKRTDARELRRFHTFYLAFPQIRESLSPEFTNPLSSRIQET